MQELPKKNKRPDTPLADSPNPDYSDMITAKRGFSKDSPYTPTAIDSSYYKQGFNMAVKGKTVPPAYDMKTRQGMSGYYEATKKGLNPRKK